MLAHAGVRATGGGRWLVAESSSAAFRPRLL